MIFNRIGDGLNLDSLVRDLQKSLMGAESSIEEALSFLDKQNLNLVELIKFKTIFNAEIDFLDYDYERLGEQNEKIVGFKDKLEELIEQEYVNFIWILKDLESSDKMIEYTEGFFDWNSDELEEFYKFLEENISNYSYGLLEEKDYEKLEEFKWKLEWKINILTIQLDSKWDVAKVLSDSKEDDMKKVSFFSNFLENLHYSDEDEADEIVKYINSWLKANSLALNKDNILSLITFIPRYKEIFLNIYSIPGYENYIKQRLEKLEKLESQLEILIKELETKEGIVDGVEQN